MGIIEIIRSGVIVQFSWSLQEIAAWKRHYICYIKAGDSMDRTAV